MALHEAFRIVHVPNQTSVSCTRRNSKSEMRMVGKDKCALSDQKVLGVNFTCCLLEQNCGSVHSVSALSRLFEHKGELSSTDVVSELRW